MRYFIKKIILLLLYYSFRDRQHNGLLVLTYHRISDTSDYEDSLKVSKNIFEKQIQYLKNNYTILSGEELSDIIRNKKPFPDNSCLITFDDGWRDNYTNAYPILKKYKIPAIIFISTDFISTYNIFWHEQLQELLKNIPANTINKELDKLLSDWPGDIRKLISEALKQPNSKRQLKISELISTLKLVDPEKIDELIIKLSKIYNQKLIDESLMLSWNEINEMSQNNICFGSHTKSHAILTQVSHNSVIKELKESKDIIENKLGKQVHYLSYPNGNYNKDILNVAKKNGYLAGFTCKTGLNITFESSLELKRKHIREDQSLGINRGFSDLFFRIDLADVRRYI